MVKMVNTLTGTEMWVDEARVDEYKAAGHVPAAEPEKKPVRQTKKRES